MSSIVQQTETFLKDMSKYFFEELGLKDFKVTEMTSLIDKPLYRITIYKDFYFDLIDLRTDKPQQLIIDTFKKELSDPILASDAVKEILSEQQKKLIELEKENNELKQVINELQPFKVHYELDYKLKHGKNE